MRQLYLFLAKKSSVYLRMVFKSATLIYEYGPRAAIGHSFFHLYVGRRYWLLPRTTRFLADNLLSKIT